MDEIHLLSFAQPQPNLVHPIESEAANLGTGLVWSIVFHNAKSQSCEGTLAGRMPDCGRAAIRTRTQKTAERSAKHVKENQYFCESTRKIEVG